jgi:hypothetical protein
MNFGLTDERKMSVDATRDFVTNVLCCAFRYRPHG